MQTTHFFCNKINLLCLDECTPKYAQERRHHTPANKDSHRLAPGKSQKKMVALAKDLGLLKRLLWTLVLL